MDTHTRFASTLTACAEDLGISLTDEQAERLWTHFERMAEANRQFNLTGITDPADAAAKLYADSLAPLAWVQDNSARVRSCLDVGTGAGFPAVPLAVTRPAWSVTAIDSTGKKATFVKQCAEAIPIANLHALQARAGEWKPSKTFDLVVFKALGALAKCLSAATHLVARDGYVIVFKGPNLSRRELDDGQLHAERMGLQTWDVCDYDLPLGDETLKHTLVVYRRVQ